MGHFMNKNNQQIPPDPLLYFLYNKMIIFNGIMQRFTSMYFKIVIEP